MPNPKTLLNKKISRRQFIELLIKGAIGAGLGYITFHKTLEYLTPKPLEYKYKTVDEKKHALKEAMFYTKLAGGNVKCGVCFRGCLIPTGGRSFCRNKINDEGTLYTLVYGRPCSLQLDPIEKEPVFHMLPGSNIFCTAATSCNFRCMHCHNWQISQSFPEDARTYDLPPEKIVDEALKHDCRSVSFTYSEPTAFYEYVHDTCRLAREKGLKTIIHTNGGMQAKPMNELSRHLDAVTVDLKGFTREFYNNVSSAELQPVLDTLKLLSKKDVWLEIVNLIIPTLNDNPDDIRDMCEWIMKNVGNVPLHFNRFSPAYRMLHLPPTPPDTLETARNIALKTGLDFVYIGNMPGHEANSTYCPECGRILIRRIHFNVLENKLKDGGCRHCGREIPGVWS
jgi:pyruvate formate lyase activating enzyme